jgi:hypothetical protein
MLQMLLWSSSSLSFFVVGGSGGGEITDCKLNSLGITSRFCTLTMFVVVNLLQLFIHQL